MYKESQLPRLSRFPPGVTKGGSETKLKRISIAGPALSSGESPLLLPGTPTPSTGSSSAVSFPLLRVGGSPDALKSQPQPCTAFAAAAAGRERWTRKERRIFLIGSPPVLSRSPHAIAADKLIALYTPNSSIFCSEIRSQKELRRSKSKSKKMHRTAGN